jgi:hypothetical protein
LKAHEVSWRQYDRSAQRRQANLDGSPAAGVAFAEVDPANRSGALRWVAVVRVLVECAVQVEQAAPASAGGHREPST